MILATIYNVVGLVLIVVGLVSAFGGGVGSMTAGGAVVLAGLVCVGFGEVFSSISKIAENTKRLAEVKTPNYSMEFTRLIEAMTISNDLLRKLLAANKTVSPVAPALPVASSRTGDLLYYYSDAQMNRQGPFRAEQMKIMARDGRIQSDTPVVCDGWEDWKPFIEVSELA